MSTSSSKRLLRLRSVLDRVPYGRSRLYELIAEGKFPPPIKLAGGKASAWLESDIDTHIEGLMQAAGREPTGASHAA